MRPAPESSSSEQARFTTGIAGLLLIALLVGAAPAGASSAGATGAPPGSHWLRNARDPRWVQGEIALAAAPTEVWGRIADVEHWPALFSDMASFSVDSRSPDGKRWVVRFESRAFGHGRHEYVATLDAASRSIRMVVDTIGVRGAADATVVPSGEGRTRANYSVFIETHGIAGWFVSETDLRERQERLVQRTLRDLDTAFGHVTR